MTDKKYFYQPLIKHQVVLRYANITSDYLLTFRYDSLPMRPIGQATALIPLMGRRVIHLEQIAQEQLESYAYFKKRFY